MLYIICGHFQYSKIFYLCIKMHPFMELQALTAICPVDGRYRNQVAPLSAWFSEYAFIRYRVLVEIEYFIALCKLPLPQLADFPASRFADLRKLYTDFSIADANRVKEVEKITNHDVKAVEYFIKERFGALGIQSHKEFVHFGLTSQDINNTSVPYSLQEFISGFYLNALNELIEKLTSLSREWESIPMLARTHGQPASPTRLGKEIRVFVERLNKQAGLLETIPYAAKFGGATGNLNAHKVAYPDIDWVSFANQFVNETLGLERSQTTTQIEHYDHLAALCDNLKRINVIMLDLSKDCWTYISMDYFKQRIKEGEVGSSAMPHKVNPIDFENAEGNLGMANAIFEHLSSKLPISRLQRDLTDSTVIRNLGVPMAHTIIAFNSLKKGLGKLIVNELAISEDLDKNWAVIAEAIQTILRREAYPNPFEALKALTRTNESITRERMHTFIDSLDISIQVKNELKRITPSNYTGI
jgi:adenylosuccinate lyase